MLPKAERNESARTERNGKSTRNFGNPNQASGSLFGLVEAAVKRGEPEFVTSVFRQYSGSIQAVSRHLGIRLSRDLGLYDDLLNQALQFVGQGMIGIADGK
ncbi:MAG: hypothetical protein OHK0035_31670 [Cyanobacteria bacterium J069]